jgi:hypothetical protein
MTNDKTRTKSFLSIAAASVVAAIALVSAAVLQSATAHDGFPTSFV